MAYAQTAYTEKMGNGPYTIADIGCLLTAICNTLQADYGVAVDPPTLNAWFESHNYYISDPGDGAGVKDDLSWNSITQFHPQAVVTQIGGAGWPSSNNAIVKFYYKSARTGAMETHFCKVADHNAHTIVDSWDGITKETGEYGTPIGWATYGTPSVQPVVTAANPPVAASPQPTTPPATGVTSLFLPSAAGTWRVYNVAGPYSSAPVDHSIHKLVPGAFPPGLTYPVLGTLAPHVYKIQTQDYGQVAIYAGPDTIAQFPGGGHGEGEDSVPSNAVLSTLTEPMNLVTNKEATLYDYETGVAQSTLAANTPFRADHKAVNGDNVYFIDSSDAGTVGVKTIDLSPSTSSPEPTPTETPTTPPVSWQKSFTAGLGSVKYIANTPATVYDLAEVHNPVTLTKGTIKEIAGQFAGPDGRKYYRTQASVATDNWLGIPVAGMTKINGDMDDEALETLFADMAKDGEQAGKAVASKTIGGLFRKKKGAK